MYSDILINQINEARAALGPVCTPRQGTQMQRSQQQNSSQASVAPQKQKTAKPVH